MIESKIWHNKTEIKNVKVVKTVEFIKTCDQYPHKFNFGHFFSSIILPPFCCGKNRFSENAVQVKQVISFCLRESFIGAISKNEKIQFLAYKWLEG